jgi:hypothetical protein
MWTFMLGDSNKPIMLSDIMQGVVMLNVIMLSVIKLGVFILNAGFCYAKCHNAE